MKRYGPEDWRLLGLVLIVVVLAASALYSTLPHREIKADDLVAQYTLYLVSATVALVLSSLFQFYFLSRADQVTRKTAQAAIAANRPWLDFMVEVDGPLCQENEFGVELLAVKLKVCVENIGRSPAVRCNFWTRARSLGSQPLFSLPGTSNFAVFPGKVIDLDHVWAKLRNKDIKRLLLVNGDMLSMVIEFEVEYEFDGGVGSTKRSFELKTTDLMGLLHLSRLPLQRDQLHLEQTQYLDSAS